MSRKNKALTEENLRYYLENSSDSESFCEDSDDSLEDPSWIDCDPDAGSSSDEEDLPTADGEDVGLLVDNLVREEEEEEQVESSEGEEEINQRPNDVMWTEYEGRSKYFEFTGPHGLQKEITDVSPLDIYLHIIDHEVLNLIVKETNKFAEQSITTRKKTKYSRINKWTDTDEEEIKKFLGLTLWMGLVRISSLQDYWAKKGIYRNEIPSSVMSRNRYQLLLSMLHFKDNKEIVVGDRLGKIQGLVDMMQRKYQELYCPGEDIVIDETLVPWRGRLIFRQYIPNKAHRYGIKLFKLCSTDGFTWSLKIYSGKSASGVRETGLAQNVCLLLAKDLLNQGRTLYIDNFYTSYTLAKTLLNEKTHVVGTFRKTRKDIPKEVATAKLKRGEVKSLEDPNGIVVLLWKDTRDVRLLSTKHAPIMVPVNRPKKSKPKSHIDSNEPSTSQDDTTFLAPTDTGSDPDITSDPPHQFSVHPLTIAGKKRKNEPSTSKETTAVEVPITQSQKRKKKQLPKNL